MARGEVTGRKPRVTADCVEPPRRGKPREDDDVEPSPHREPKPGACARHSPIRGPPKKKPRPWRALPQAPAAYFIEEFCAAYRLSPSMYFKLKTEGKGPTEMQVGRRRMISFEAAEQWRREREATSPA
jgi:hypothetical protein